MVLAGLLFHVVLFCFTAGPFLAPALHQTLDLLKNTPSLIAHLPLTTLSSNSWLPFPTLPAPPPPNTYNLIFIDLTAPPGPTGQSLNDSGYVYHEGFEPIPVLPRGIMQTLWKKYGALLGVALLLDIIVVLFIATVSVLIFLSLYPSHSSVLCVMPRFAYGPSADCTQ